MSADQRQSALAEAFRDGNKEIIGAIVGFDKIMHGCNPDYVAASFDDYQRKVAPNEYATVESHKRYVGYLDRAGPNLMAFTTRALKGTGGYVKKAEVTKAVLASFGLAFED